jgi:uroporphyrinogen III methyltransferase/synthase
MKNRPGKVYIVGAGPGDCGLLTVKGLEKLNIADVVVYDRLINHNLLSCCKDDCEKIFVGKESGYHPIEQEKITEILLNKSKAGNIVVRLKGGNPFVFGRGSEEAIALKKAGIDFEIVPGITSGLAAPIYSGIPITQRGLITQCVFVTAHECPDKPGTQVEWEKLAKLKNTSLVIYMGASRIENISRKLIEYGMDPATPAAIVENGTLPNQRTITARLDCITKEFKKENFHAPTIIMISPAISLRDEISWFEKKPLLNKRIVITGEKTQKDELYHELSELGAEVLRLSIIKTQINNPWIDIQELFTKNKFGWVLFTGEHEVNSFFELLKRKKYDSRIFGNKKIASIGSATSKALEAFGLTPDYSREDSSFASTSESIFSNYQMNGYELLWIKNFDEHQPLPAEFKSIEKRIRTINVCEYIPDNPDQNVITDIEKNGANVFVFTTPASIVNFFKLFGNEAATRIIHNAKVLVTNPAAAGILCNKNLRNVIVTPKNTVQEICEVIYYLF